jgi:hypothetical protein
MAKFVVVHTVPPGAVTREQINELARASQEDSAVRGYRSFLNLSEGKLVCVMEAADRGTVAAWFDRVGVPYDSITLVEWEGERGRIEAA